MELAGSFRASRGADAGLPDDAGGSPPPRAGGKGNGQQTGQPRYGRGSQRYSSFGPLCRHDNTPIRRETLRGFKW